MFSVFNGVLGVAIAGVGLIELSNASRRRDPLPKLLLAICARSNEARKKKFAGVIIDPRARFLASISRYRALRWKAQKAVVKAVVVAVLGEIQSNSITSGGARVTFQIPLSAHSCPSFFLHCSRSPQFMV